MQIADFTMTNKGAANGQPQTQSNDWFTYMAAEDNGDTLHVFSGEQHEAWINSRDNGQDLNMDSSMVSRLMAKV